MPSFSKFDHDFQVAGVLFHCCSFSIILTVLAAVPFAFEIQTIPLSIFLLLTSKKMKGMLLAENLTPSYLFHFLSHKVMSLQLTSILGPLSLPNIYLIVFLLFCIELRNF